MRIRHLSALVILLTPLAAWSQSTTCYEWQNSGGAWFKTPLLAVQARKAQCEVSDATMDTCTSSSNVCNGPQFDNCTVEIHNPPVFGTFPAVSNSGYLRVRRVTTSSHPGGAGIVDYATISSSITSRVDARGCPRCPDAGTRRTMTNANDNDAGDRVCLDGCEYTFTPGYWSIEIGGGGGSSMVASSGTATGRACQASSNAPGADEQEGDCFEAGGMTICAETFPALAAVVDGDRVTPSRIGNGDCVEYGSGAVACDDAATDVPDTGTPGVDAPPDVTVITSSNTANYFNNTTVSGSSTPPVTGPPSSGDPEGEDDEGEGSGGGGEGLMCEEGDPNCSEEGAEGTGEDPRGGWQCWADGEGFGAAVAACYASASETMWNTLVDESSLLSIANATADAFPDAGGTCPTDVATIDWQGAAFNLDFWEAPCGFLVDVEAVLGPLFLLMWGFVALRILLSIPGGE